MSRPSPPRPLLPESPPLSPAVRQACLRSTSVCLKRKFNLSRNMCRTRATNASGGRCPDEHVDFQVPVSSAESRALIKTMSSWHSRLAHDCPTRGDLIDTTNPYKHRLLCFHVGPVGGLKIRFIIYKIGLGPEYQQGYCCSSAGAPHAGSELCSRTGKP